MKYNKLILVFLFGANCFCCNCSFPDTTSNNPFTSKYSLYKAYMYAKSVFIGSIIKANHFMVDDTCHKNGRQLSIHEISFKVIEMLKGENGDTATYLNYDVSNYIPNYMIGFPDIIDTGNYLVFASPIVKYRVLDSCINVNKQTKIDPSKCCIGTKINNTEILDIIDNIRNSYFINPFYKQKDLKIEMTGFFRFMTFEEDQKYMQELKRKLEKIEQE